MNVMSFLGSETHNRAMTILPRNTELAWSVVVSVEKLIGDLGIGKIGSVRMLEGC